MLPGLIRFLVVEDEVEIARMITEKLKLMGFPRVEHRSDGTDAYNYCVKSLRDKTPVQIIICDWRMPSMSGVELLEKLRSNEFFRSVKFLMISAVDDPESIRRAAQLKIDGYLVKPFSMDDFEKKINSFIKTLD